MSKKIRLRRQSVVTISAKSRAFAGKLETSTARLPSLSFNRFKFSSVSFSNLLVGIVVVGFLFLLTRQPEASQTVLNIFLGLTIEALPFLLLGALVAATLETWGQRTRLLKRLWQLNRPAAIVTGLGLGLALPVCECGTASVARQAQREGAPVALSLVFLLAAPILNPVTILVTWLAFGNDWLIVVGRPVLCLLLATSLGLLLSFHPHSQELFNHQRSDTHHHEELHHTYQEVLANRDKLALFLNQTVSQFLQAAKVALPGIALAAGLQVFISPRYLLELGQGALWSAIALMLVAAVMSVCSSVDAFVALSFSALFPAGSILAFLVFGPLINLKSLFLLRMVLSWRAIGVIALLVFQLVLVVAVFINLRIA